LKRDPKEREIIQKNYEKAGIPYKSVLLLHGDPGCGKSSLIKATIDYTGRHCILVSWSKIRTCNDFASLFRPLKINQKTYYSNELILVFEDFDANNNDIIKKRKNMKIHDEKNENKRENEETDSEISTIEESIKTKILNEFKLTPQKLEDEITLEFILNVLDGIIELYDIIVFFTTNDIDIIDPALKRTGRIDKIIKMEKANCKNICEMLAHRYNLSETELKKYETEINLVPEYENSYSDISQICNYSKTVEECLSNIVKMKK
jgi:chaperone BCS1